MINLLINDLSMNDLSMNDLSLNDLSMNDISQSNIIYNKDFSKYRIKLIIITVFLLIVESFLLLRVNKLTDRIILYLAIYGQILLLFSLNINKPFLTEVSHMIFGVSILSILCFSKDIIMNLLCYNVLLITIISRYLFGGCIMLKCNETNISFLPKLNYNIIYNTLYGIVIIKLLYLI